MTRLDALRDDGPLAGRIGRPGHGGAEPGSGWLGPPLVRAIEYGGLIALTAAGDRDALPACFALPGRDRLSPLRHDLQSAAAGRVAQPRWLALVGGGWELRLVAVGILAAAGVLEPGLDRRRSRPWSTLRGRVGGELASAPGRAARGGAPSGGAGDARVTSEGEGSGAALVDRRAPYRHAAHVHHGPGGPGDVGGEPLHAPRVAVLYAAPDRRATLAEHGHGAHDPGRPRCRFPVLTVPGILAAVGAVLLVQLQVLLDCSDGEIARWRNSYSPRGIYLDQIAHYATEAAIPAGLGVRAASGWGSIDGWTSLGLLVAVLILLLKSETHLAGIARLRAGRPVQLDPTPTRIGRLHLRDGVRLLPFLRPFQAVEASLLAFAAAIGDELAGEPLGTRVLLVVLAAAALVAVVGHGITMLRSDRLR